MPTGDRFSFDSIFVKRDVDDEWFPIKPLNSSIDITHSDCIVSDLITTNPIEGRVFIFGNPYYEELIKKRLLDRIFEEDCDECDDDECSDDIDAMINELFGDEEDDDDEIIDCHVKRVIFNDPATVIFWEDGTKTVVKCAKGDKFNPYYGFCAAVTKRVYDNNSSIKSILETKSNYNEIMNPKPKKSDKKKENKKEK